MGDLTLNCPLCCNNTFDSKESLVKHLNIDRDFNCPVCSIKLPSIALLIQHLSIDNCSTNTVQTLLFDNTETDANEFQTENSDHIDYKSLETDETIPDSPFLPIQSLDTEDMDANKMYVELMKPCLQTQELKLLKDSTDRYVIITDDQEELGNVLTKQNNDGTISLTSVKDMKLDPDTLIATTEPEPETTQEELYSCNTCGVSFTSVIEHIQNYHNNQDVVVEGAIADTDNNSLPIYETVDNEDSNTGSEKQVLRRVITDTGDIVETPAPLQKTEIEIVPETPKVQPKEKKPTKRFVQVDKLCYSVIKDLKKTDQNDGPYHKVMMKEVVALDGKKIKMYRCMWCSVIVQALGDFKQHPCKMSRYSCNQCTVTYDNAKSLCAHMKVHKSRPDDTILPPETYECEICCTIFPTNKSLKLHKRMHDPLKSRPIEAPKNSNSSELKYHCTVCDKAIPMDYKTIHQNSHKIDTMLNCAICNKKFSSAEYLEMHMNVHNLDKAPLSKQDQSLPYSCIYCDRRFARPHEKVKHERIHTGEKPHSCEICGKSFRVSYCLTLHMRTHTGARPYECPHCGKRFKAHSVYNHHLLTHSDVRAYKCPFCPKAFKTSVQLAGHKNSHTKPFSCTQCNRPFASLYAVRVHTETHNRTNNLKFSCTLCGASYARAFALRDHMKQIHQNDDAIDITDNLASQDAWSTQATTDSDDIQSLNKDINNEIKKMEMANDEFIVPN